MQFARAVGGHDLAILLGGPATAKGTSCLMVFLLGYILSAAAFYALCCLKAPMQEVGEAKVIYLPLPEEAKKAA